MLFTLYHGSHSENRERILSEGLRWVDPPSLERIVGIAENNIRSALGIEWRMTAALRKSVVARLLESRKRGGVVYLSSDRRYAEQNAVAGKEWLEAILNSALRAKYKREYARLSSLGDKSLTALLDLEASDKEMHGADIISFMEKSRAYFALERAYREASKEYGDASAKMRSVAHRHYREIIGNGCTLFTVRMGREDLSRVATPRTTGSLDGLDRLLLKTRSASERARLVRSLLREVTVERVDPRFIVSAEDFDYREREAAHPQSLLS